MIWWLVISACRICFSVIPVDFCTALDHDRSDGGPYKKFGFASTVHCVYCSMFYTPICPATIASIAIVVVNMTSTFAFGVTVHLEGVHDIVMW